MITVIFSATVREDADLEEVQGGQLRMLERLMDNPGFLEAKPYTSDDGETVMIVKFASQEALDAWRQDPEHIVTMERGRAEWLDSYWGAEVVMRVKWDRRSGRTVLPGGPVSSPLRARRRRAPTPPVRP